MYSHSLSGKFTSELCYVKLKLKFYLKLNCNKILKLKKDFQQFAYTKLEVSYNIIQAGTKTTK